MIIILTSQVPRHFLEIVMKEKHSTDFEIEYIKKIGETHLQTISIPKHVMLKNYIKACGLRADWGNLDKQKVIAEAQLELYKCQERR